MITFILNNEKIQTDEAPGSSLLDFIRYEKGLTGTKTGCREGDCGACTVLMGTPEKGVTEYKSVVSCLTPLINAHGKHIVTIEGLNCKHLIPAQKAIVDHSATQCGFCTPGFVMSLTAASLTAEKLTAESAIASVSGNICRCTGYKTIEKAAEAVADILKDREINDPVGWLVRQGHLPEYFLSVPEMLAEIAVSVPPAEGGDYKIAGATDLMVQKAEEIRKAVVTPLNDREDLRGIRVTDGRCFIGAATTISEAMKSQELKKIIPGTASSLKLVASESVRNMATFGGNIVNASPIGDLTIMLLALDSEVILEGPEGERRVLLKDFFLGYKKTDLGKNEIIKTVAFDCKPDNALFSFEKVSKRMHLDIASVNSALRITLKEGTITQCSLSAGGVSPVPLLLHKTSRYFLGKRLSPDIIREANKIMQDEISPISDVRGSAEYKRLLLRQLMAAHFLKLFPESLNLSLDML